MVANCICSCSPHRCPCIDDILTGTRPVSRGKGKVLDPQAYDQHCGLVYRPFEALFASYLQVKPEKCQVFMEPLAFCGHVLERAHSAPAPRKLGPSRQGRQIFSNHQRPSMCVRVSVTGCAFIYLIMRHSLPHCKKPTRLSVCMWRKHQARLRIDVNTLRTQMLSHGPHS